MIPRTNGVSARGDSGQPLEERRGVNELERDDELPVHSDVAILLFVPRSHGRRNQVVTKIIRVGELRVDGELAVPAQVPISLVVPGPYCDPAQVPEKRIGFGELGSYGFLEVGVNVPEQIILLEGGKTLAPIVQVDVLVIRFFEETPRLVDGLPMPAHLDDGLAAIKGLGLVIDRIDHEFPARIDVAPFPRHLHLAQTIRKSNGQTLDVLAGDFVHGGSVGFKHVIHAAAEALKLGFNHHFVILVLETDLPVLDEALQLVDGRGLGAGHWKPDGNRKAKEYSQTQKQTIRFHMDPPWEK